MINRPNCYVCKNPIRGESVYIGQGIHRHIRCEPGSRRYMQNRKLRNLYLQDLGMSWEEYKERHFGDSKRGVCNAESQ